MDGWLVLTLVLFVAGLVVTAIEVVVPSGGLLALVALACLGGSLASAYQISGGTAATMAVIEVICVPTVIALVFKYLPKTSMGKQLILSPPDDEPQEQNPSRHSPAANPYEYLNGKEGIVVTSLRPSGTAEFDGRRISVVSDGEIIESEQRIKVVLVEGNRVVVEAIDS